MRVCKKGARTAESAKNNAVPCENTTQPDVESDAPPSLYEAQMIKVRSVLMGAIPFSRRAAPQSRVFSFLVFTSSSSRRFPVRSVFVCMSPLPLIDICAR